jgi:hypothetical protein
VAKEPVEARRPYLRQGCAVHLFDRSELLYGHGHPSSFKSKRSRKAAVILPVFGAASCLSSADAVPHDSPRCRIGTAPAQRDSQLAGVSRQNFTDMAQKLFRRSK